MNKLYSVLTFVLFRPAEISNISHIIFFLIVQLYYELLLWIIFIIMNLLTKDYDLTKETVVKKFLLSLYCKRYYKLNKISILYKDYAFRGFI